MKDDESGKAREEAIAKFTRRPTEDSKSTKEAIKKAHALNWFLFVGGTLCGFTLILTGIIVYTRAETYFEGNNTWSAAFIAAGGILILISLQLHHSVPWLNRSIQRTLKSTRRAK